jgi:hypothetical protein
VIPEHLTLTELAAKLRVSHKAAWRWVRRHKLPNRNPGGAWWVWESDVVAVMRAGEPPPVEQASVDYRQQGKDDCDKRFSERPVVSWRH